MTDAAQHRKQLAHIARMAAIGELTGGITHHLRNNLAVIFGNLQLLAEGDQQFLQGKSKQMVSDALSAAQKNADLTRTMSDLSIFCSENDEVTDANEVVHDFADLARVALGKDARVESRLADGTLRVRIGRGELAASLLFLLLNSRRAMPSSGTLVIATRVSEQGTKATISVSDSGCGMEPEVLQRATELFYTTRNCGQAGGLGLSIAEDIAKSAQGELNVDSAAGDGTTVSIILPLLS